jgi:phage terminase large subunit-like protein
VPRGEVDAKLAEAMESYKVLELACDPPGWHREIEQWDQTYGSVVVLFETNQPRRMAPACDRFRSAVLEGGLTHDGDPALARHVANCVIRESSSGTVITKPDPTRKIDAAVAAVVAFERAAWHAEGGRIVPWLEVISG